MVTSGRPARARARASWNEDLGLRIAIYAFMVSTAGLVVFPLWFIITASFSEASAVMRGENLLWFKGFQTEGYEKIFADPKIYSGYMNSFVYSVLGAITETPCMPVCAVGVASVQDPALVVSARRAASTSLTTAVVVGVRIDPGCPRP